jgi:hypothetical protein
MRDRHGFPLVAQHMKGLPFIFFAACMAAVCGGAAVLPRDQEAFARSFGDRPVIRLAIALLLGLSSAALAAAPPNPDPFAEHARNPLLPGYFADPSIVHDQGEWFIYATIDPWGRAPLACGARAISATGPSPHPTGPPSGRHQPDLGQIRRLGALGGAGARRAFLDVCLGRQ